MVLKMTQSFTRSMHAVGVSVGPAKRAASESKLKTSETKQLSPNQPQHDASSSTASSFASSSGLDDIGLGDDVEEQKSDDPRAPVPITAQPTTAGISHGLIEISLAPASADDTVGLSADDLEAIDDLVECAKEGDLPLFQRLCEALARRHISADCAGYMGWTPAHWAARHGHVHILEYLLQSHVNLDILDKKGDSLLHKAAANGQFRACQWLLQHGFNVQARNNNGQTPLDVAQQLAALTKSPEAALCEAILAREDAHTF